MTTTNVQTLAAMCAGAIHATRTARAGEDITSAEATMCQAINAAIEHNVTDEFWAATADMVREMSA